MSSRTTDRQIVHLLRHSLDFVSYKDRKPVAAVLKGIYRAVDAAAGEAARIDWLGTLVRKGPDRLGPGHLHRVRPSTEPATLHLIALDTSGSMESPDKLPLLKQSFAQLVPQLRRQDRVSIVVYAGSAGLVLPPTPGDRHEEILAALDRLQAGGSTNGGDGIRLAYAMAKQAFVKEGVNRVILATDGDFNVGTVSQDALETMVADQRRSGIALTTLGFGTGNSSNLSLPIAKPAKPAGESGDKAERDYMKQLNKDLDNLLK